GGGGGGGRAEEGSAPGRGGGGADAFGNPPGNPEATPIVVNGVMYLPAGGTRIVALDAASGKELWQHELPKDTVTTARGLAYWAGDSSNPARLLFTAGARPIPPPTPARHFCSPVPNEWPRVMPRA